MHQSARAQQRHESRLGLKHRGVLPPGEHRRFSQSRDRYSSVSIRKARDLQRCPHTGSVLPFLELGTLPCRQWICPGPSRDDFGITRVRRPPWRLEDLTEISGTSRYGRMSWPGSIFRGWRRNTYEIEQNLDFVGNDFDARRGVVYSTNGQGQTSNN